ncbi:DUF624 domain-containing protein [Streptomyces spongiae]|uniref:DUF624 domain-containing protein n=1 Tax=Streptomyces spongiae TaxID=565072 RepID=UPI0018838C14|nr:DUF624 domain-containing protein [Streptomyces spongiae]
MTRTWFARFADCLLLGVLLLLASLPVVTAFPALVAGCAVLREHAYGGEGVTATHFLRRLRSVLRSGPAAWAVPTAVLALLWLDALALDAQGPGPGAAFAAATAVLAALGLRCAAAWREGSSWRTTLATVFRSVPRHPLAPALLSGATGAAAVLLALAPVLLVVILGPLAFAATAADAWRPVATT